MRPVTNLRQQLLNTQQALEQDYWRLRQVETRYRSVIDMVSDAIVVIDEQTNRILEANPIANRLLAKESQSSESLFQQDSKLRTMSLLQSFANKL